MRIDEARAHLRSREALLADGVSTRGIGEAVAAHRLTRVHPGWYVASSVWDAAYAEQKQILRVAASHRNIRTADAVASHWSAAALWNLPFYRIEPGRAHYSGPRLDGMVGGAAKQAVPSSSRAPLPIARHRLQIADDDRTVVDGIPCTSLERTVLDVVRSADPPAAISIADAALRRCAWDERSKTYDDDVADAWTDDLLGRLMRDPGGRGTRRAAHIVRFADGRAQLPGESVSRLWLARLGFAAPRLQVPVPGPRGAMYFVDFGLDDVNAWGEFDGEGKYTDAAMRGGRTVEEVVLQEKRREDWIRGTTNRRFPRWGSESIASPATLGRRLAQFAITPPPR